MSNVQTLVNPAVRSMAERLRNSSPAFYATTVWYFVKVAFAYRRAANTEMVPLNRWDRSKCWERVSETVVGILEAAPVELWDCVASGVLERLSARTAALVRELGLDPQGISHYDLDRLISPQEVGSWLAEAIFSECDYTAQAIAKALHVREYAPRALEYLLGIIDDDGPLVAENGFLTVMDGDDQRILEFAQLLGVKMRVPTAQNPEVIVELGMILWRQKKNWSRAERVLPYIAEATVRGLTDRILKEMTEPEQTRGRIVSIDDHERNAGQKGGAPIDPKDDREDTEARGANLSFGQLLEVHLAGDALVVARAAAEGYRRREMPDHLGWSPKRVNRAYRSLARDRRTGGNLLHALKRQQVRHLGHKPKP
ncbi:MAG TPA: hypothetical protein VN428_00795 [Bryobacteraceae bacterium]|nr:hypothetical protein [Bryobacteraceae bacterium]